MRLFLLAALALSAGCTTLHSQGQDAKSVWVSKQTSVLGFTFGSLYYCQLTRFDKDGGTPVHGPNPVCYEAQNSGF